MWTTNLTAVRDKLLQTPNMKTTGRLPAVLLIHLKMQVRITVSDERLAAHAPADTTGIVQNIELHPVDRTRWLQQTSEAIFVLHHAPTTLIQIDQEDTDTGLGPGTLTTTITFNLITTTMSTTTSTDHALPQWKLSPANQSRPN